MSDSGPVITFLSDYGVQDDFVGVCHGVIARICPPAHVIDLTHGIARHDVRGGALILEGALPYLPVGVHLAVVDPDVGAARRAVALRLADDRMLVGPDNGLLSLAASTAGGVVEAVEIAHSKFRLEPVSATFHGRDIFAPVAARLAAGAPLAEAGEPCDPEGLVRLSLPDPELVDEVVIAEALYVDRFGNIELNIGHEQLSAFGFRMGRTVELQTAAGGFRLTYARTFADVPEGELLAYEDAYRRLSIAISHGNAAERLGVAIGDEIRVRLQ
jgi:S-adenosyl-L-methionine hydrolase (adenosine-forming)